MRFKISNAERRDVELRGKRRMPVMVQELYKDEHKGELVKGSLIPFHELLFQIDAAERIDAIVADTLQTIDKR